MTAPTELAPPTADGPVTVAITRRVAAGDTTQMIAWVRAGTAMAELFPGFLGAGWVRPGDASDEWHMLYRFADHESCTPGRPPPSDSGGSARARASSSTHAPSAAPASRAGSTAGVHEVEAPAGPNAPPRWKQALLIWMAFFPVNLLATLTLGALIVHWPVVLRSCA